MCLHLPTRTLVGIHACPCYTGRVKAVAPSKVRASLYDTPSYHRRTSTFPTTTTSPTNGQHLRHSPEGITPSNLTSGLLGFSSMKFSARGWCPIQVLSPKCPQMWTGSEVEWGAGLEWLTDMTGGTFQSLNQSPTPVLFFEHPGAAAEITSWRHCPQGRTQTVC